MSEFASYVNIKTLAGMCLIANYTILLKWEHLCVWIRFIWHYENESVYVSECALYVIKMRAVMCLNTLYMILLKWELLCVLLCLIFHY